MLGRQVILRLGPQAQRAMLLFLIFVTLNSIFLRSRSLSPYFSFRGNVGVDNRHLYDSSVFRVVLIRCCSKRFLVGAGPPLRVTSNYKIGFTLVLGMFPEFTWASKLKRKSRSFHWRESRGQSLEYTFIP